MTLNTKLYYCECIKANRFKYSNHGREANRSIDTLLVPARAEVPGWVEDIKRKAFVPRPDHAPVCQDVEFAEDVALVRIDKIFSVTSGTLAPERARSKQRSSEDFVPYIRPSKIQSSSYSEYVDSSQLKAFVYPRHSLYVSTNGQGSHTYSYVSVERFIPNTDVSVLTPKRTMSLQEKLFYAAVITAHRPIFSYGRKPKGERLNRLLVPEWAPKYIYEESMAALIGA